MTCMTLKIGQDIAHLVAPMTRTRSSLWGSTDALVRLASLSLSTIADTAKASSKGVYRE